MFSLRTALSAFLVLVLLGACEKKESAPQGDAPSGSSAAKMVTVAPNGTKFDPPVEKSQIPEGTWICDMGSVHYARGEKGDGKCPLCSMDLKQLGASKEGAHEGHSH